MIPFRQFITETVVSIPSGIYVKVNPTIQTITKIRSSLHQLEGGVQFTDDWHCTVIYSKTSLKKVNLPYVDKHNRYEATGHELVFWEGHDKEGYIVLKLHSTDLTKLHNLFRKTGLEPTFKDYLPHLTLVHPVPDPEKFKVTIDHCNKMLKDNPLDLEFYYGGYTIMDDKDRKKE